MLKTVLIALLVLGAISAIAPEAAALPVPPISSDTLFREIACVGASLGPNVASCVLP